MINQSLIIKQLRARGKTYKEISEDLHVSFSTVSKALKARSTTLQRSTDYQASFSQDESPIYDEGTTLPPHSYFGEEGSKSTDSDSLNIKVRRLVGGPSGLYVIDDPAPSSNSQLISAPLPSWFWKLFFILVGIVMFIRILKRMGGDAFENE